MSVAECQRRVSSREFAEWKAFGRLEPYGDEWRQAAMVAWIVARVNTKRTKKIKVEDFMPALYEPPLTKSELQQKTASIFGGMIAKQKKQKGLK